MFVIVLKYVKPLSEIESHLPAHRKFLDSYYSAGRLIASGPQVPRTGGLMLAKADSRVEIERMIAEDPFKQAGVAHYEIIEFQPSKHVPGFENLL